MLLNGDQQFVTASGRIDFTVTRHGFVFAHKYDSNGNFVKGSTLLLTWSDQQVLRQALDAADAAHSTYTG